MSLGITVIDHVQIAAPKAMEAEIAHFYRDVLGLTEIARPVELKGRPGLWFQTGNLQLHIGFDPEGGGPKSKRHVCFLVTDLTKARATVTALGIGIEEEGPAGGLTRFFIRDPANNRIEIGQR